MPHGRQKKRTVCPPMGKTKRKLYKQKWELDAGEHVREIVQPLKTCEEVQQEHFEEVKR